MNGYLNCLSGRSLKLPGTWQLHLEYFPLGYLLVSPVQLGRRGKYGKRWLCGGKFNTCNILVIFAASNHPKI